MRNLFLLLLTFVSMSPFGLLAQFPTIQMRLQAGKILGKSEYFVDYTYRHKTPAESKDFQEDIIRVELGKALVKSYSYRLWQADSALDTDHQPQRYDADPRRRSISLLLLPRPDQWHDAGLLQDASIRPHAEVHRHPDVLMDADR